MTEPEAITVTVVLLAILAVGLAMVRRRRKTQ